MMVIDGENQNSILASNVGVVLNLDSSSSAIGQWYLPKSAENNIYGQCRNFPDDWWGVICEKFIKKLGTQQAARRLIRMAV
jgi:hypothetical protein